MIILISTGYNILMMKLTESVLLEANLGLIEFPYWYRQYTAFATRSAAADSL
jgi:hypothetical protein